MGKENYIELLLDIWVRLDELKKVTGFCTKALDADIKTCEKEMRSILNVLDKLIGDMISEIDENIH